MKRVLTELLINRYIRAQLCFGNSTFHFITSQFLIKIIDKSVSKNILCVHAHFLPFCSIIDCKSILP